MPAAGPPRVTVVMPTHGQEAFLPAAVSSLLAQEGPTWELVVVDDASPGDVAAALGPALDDPRVTLVRLPTGVGLGAALNRGLDLARGDVIAYLPSDDVVHAGHLAALVAALDADEAAALAVTGVRHDLTRTSPGQIEGEPLQLVQVAHRRTDLRWLERSELTTDDLGRMLWDRLLERGHAASTGSITCEWVAHPAQRHRCMREPWGGVNPYRTRYRVQEPLRFQSTVGSLHDEVAQFAPFRERPPTPRAADGLRILLVGELAHNPERILVLEERGHELHGLWTPDPVWFNAVGPQPFGHVADVPREGWRDAVRALRPDVIYALLNWQAVRFCHEVLEAGLDVPFVWHFKEGPHLAREQGLWPQLAALHSRADAAIFSSDELRTWTHATIPASRDVPSEVIDGDLPKAELSLGEPSPLLSESDGAVHTVIAGRPMGPDPEVVGALAAADVHVHLYGEKAAAQMRSWVDACLRVAPDHLHLHPQIGQARWIPELSRYDAGWLHTFESRNGGDPHAATWDDLNVPARMATYAAAGVPVIQRDNAGSMVASRSMADRYGSGVAYVDADDLIGQLRDAAAMAARRKAAWGSREDFTFDAHVDRLVGVLRAAAERR